MGACGSTKKSAEDDVASQPPVGRVAPDLKQSPRTQPPASQNGWRWQSPRTQPGPPKGQAEGIGALLGHEVIIKGLQDRPDLEGEAGSVIMWDEYEGLYTVELTRFRNRKIFARDREMVSTGQ
mmetsp:Transcript_11771/g.34636  ORF Transcript_11771/g.34636 Transcript_11771/m.34636 type:complete len:123 (-) Transcript_11771:55-423(-)